MLSINPVQSYNNKPNKVSFTSVYVLHLPKRFSKLPVTDLQEILKTKGHECRLLNNVLKQFKLLVKMSDPKSEVDYYKGIKLRNGETAYLRINDKETLQEIAFNDFPENKLLAKTEDKDTRHYFVNQFDKIQLMG